MWVNTPMSITRKYVAENLRRWMVETPSLSTQTSVAKKAGIAQSHIGRILREESSATVDMLEAIAHAFRRLPEELLVSPSIDDSLSSKKSKTQISLIVAAFSQEEQRLIEGYREASQRDKEHMLWMADRAMRDFSPRSESRNS
ncbi:MAG TPA: helix-turn-helix transcriptional regulator [Rhodocyclaceae bacterium]|nr:helix-turn-helix transcriptional regulator [Rhodocyclaceae bacterium]